MAHFLTLPRSSIIYEQVEAYIFMGQFPISTSTGRFSKNPPISGTK